MEQERRGFAAGRWWHLSMRVPLPARYALVGLVILLAWIARLPSVVAPLCTAQQERCQLLGLYGGQPLTGFLLPLLAAALVCMAVALFLLILQRQPVVPLLFIYALGVAAYFVLRFGGQWAEGDTSRITQAILYTSEVGRIVPNPPGLAYVSGLAYAAISLFLVDITGLSLLTLQRLVYPFLAVGNLLLVHALYSALLRHRSAALLATLFLYLQADYLFATFRGSHEKVTWALVLLAFLLLTRSFASPGRLLRSYVLLFYLTVFALVATNWLFAVSFILALGLSFAGGYLAMRWGGVGPRRDEWQGAQHSIYRLLSIAVSCGALLYLFLFHIYPVTQLTLGLLASLPQRLAALLLNFELAVSPYSYVQLFWLHPVIYLMLTLFNYTILAISLVGWLRMTRSLWAERAGLDALRPELLLWLLYPAFGIQLASSVLIDYTGLLGGNFQVRLFTPMMLVAIPLAAQLLWDGAERLRGTRLWPPGLALATLCVAWFSLASLLKVTNEPLLNNLWMFYTPGEQAAGQWAVEHVADEVVWTGNDERLLAALRFHFYPDALTRFDAWAVEGKGYVLLSEAERSRSKRLGDPLPPVGGAPRIYDNGNTQIFQHPPGRGY